MRVLAQIWVTGVLGGAAVAKLLQGRRSVDALAHEIVNLGLVPRFGTVAAWCVVVAELVLAVSVLVPSFAIAALGGACILIFCFSIVLALQARRGIAPCQCFGSLGRIESAWTRLAQNVSMGTCCALGLFDVLPARTAGEKVLAISIGVIAAGTTLFGHLVAQALRVPGPAEPR